MRRLHVSCGSCQAGFEPVLWRAPNAGTKGKNMSYRLVTYAAAAGPRAGVVIGDEEFDAARLTGRAGDATVLGLLDDWAAAGERLGRAAPAPGTGERLAGVRLLAPIRWPSAIYCAGANYAD